MRSLKRRQCTDKAAHWVISLGGAATIFVMLILFLFIFYEVYPLLRHARVLKTNNYLFKGTAVALGIDEQQTTSYAIYEEGAVEFLSLSRGGITKRHTLSGFNQALITSTAKEGNSYALGTNDGRIVEISINFPESFLDGEMNVLPEISEGETIQITNERKALKHLAFRENDSARVFIAHSEDGRLLLVSSETKESLFGAGEKKEIRKDIANLITPHGLNRSIPPASPPVRGKAGKSNTGTAYNPAILTEQRNAFEVTSLALDHFMENLYVATSAGEIFHINVQDKENPFLVNKIKASEKAITALGFLLGDVSLVIGDEGGNVTVWMQTRDEASPTGWFFRKVHTLMPHNAPVLAVTSSLRDKGFVTAAADGTIRLNHSTSEQTRLSLQMTSSPAAIAFSPKANSILAVDSDGKLYHWHISNPHPEITLKTLFGRVWYEGYENPEFVWQSTGGTDDFEPKLSLVPLIFGTVKGTIYAMLIAVPIGVFAALYTSQFLNKTLKIIKPVIEIMAALPSVILGFLAGLWLAPLMERIFPAIIIMPFFMLFSIALAFYVWKYIPSRLKGRYRYGAEALFLIPFIIGAVVSSVLLNGTAEQLIFGGDYSQWLLNVLGLKYDQRNAVVVGFAMGFAVIPLVFTISEDAISNVPNSLISASLALGATQWQTAVRVVLPTASPGIFSAVMIGFGRAVGETMIVLMATGNTPVMDWNVFNGFRALAANIAVEIPEAPFGGTLYRVLFLAALLLFATTFIINTFAETVRQRMRRKYSKL